MSLFPHSLSVFFPAYNDSPSLPGLLARTFRVLGREVADFEVIVVNDGSADDTGAVLERLQVQYGPRLRIVTHPVNRGYGGALRSGFAAARHDWVFYTDGDSQYDVAELPKLLAQVDGDVALVNGYKIQRHDPWHRIVIGAVYNQFARFVFGIRLRDIDCDYRLVRRSVLERISLSSTSGTICVELVKKIENLGVRVAEVPVSHQARLYGRSQFFRLPSLFNTFFQLTRLHRDLVLAPLLRSAFGLRRVVPREEL